jgi:hypothetical protein
MRPPVLTKIDMYARLNAGEFGNTLPAWEDPNDWWADVRELPGLDRRLWGVRSKVANDPLTKLNVPTAEVFDRVGLISAGANITCMVKPWSPQLECDVCRRPDGPGLTVSGNVGPIKPGSWREHMKTPKLWEGSRATVILGYHLNANSYDDLMILLEEYPDHVVELSALDHCFGTVPGRNAVIWEVRKY